MTKLIQSCIKMQVLSLLSFFLFLTHATSQSQLYEQEHAVLLKIKQYLHNPPFLSHWNPSNTSHCNWPEITCSNGSVTSLAMINTNITQTIPPFICALSNLTYIDFQWNYIPGEFPTYLYSCSKLEHLDLSENCFVGKIPDDIDHLASLKFLSLGANNFSGDIPVSIGTLKEVANLQLYQCQFNGTIPDEIGNLSNLETLHLFLNSKLPSTKLPSSLTKLSKLKTLYMYGSNLVGEIPESIGEMVALEDLDLSQNGLSGQIPRGLFMLKNLSDLYLWKNRISGEIAAVVEAFNLKNLDISQNYLTGRIPEDFGKLKKLTVLSLATNQLSGEVPESIGTLPALTDFVVFSNNLSGTLPKDFGRYSNLETFQVASNSFTGKLPENLCYNGMLVGLTAFDNNLNGGLPESLGNCDSLQYLRVENNELSGNIPSGLWASMNLSTFMISQNKFTGQLPEQVKNLSSLAISYNQFSGRIPAGVSSWKNVVVFNASSNLFNGSIPQGLTALPKLTTLLLDQNQLTGPLPSDVISWKSLITLNLSHNQLSGEIPPAIGKLPALNMLDLSENKISGKIPPQLALMGLTNLNLSSNYLKGKIPSDFENLAYDRSFLNNSGLCADTPVLKLTLCNSGPPTQRASNNGPLLSHAELIILLVIASLLAFISSLWLIRFYRKRQQDLRKSWKLTSFQRLSFTKSNIVSSMTEENIIGRGGYGAVYRVAVDRLGYVAVKKIRSSRELEPKLESSFLAEVEILSNIRHNNIVKLLCCISSEDSLLLVYEYLENHSLDKWLHKKSKSGSVHYDNLLDWPRRLHIAIGAAQGLCYMHHDCSPPVVHRDVKTSNILLDLEFNAKVADFGLATMLINSEELATMSAVAGTFGYIAPEYAQTTRVNEKIDVYSFGVILLELTTGKEANQGDEHSSLAEWASRRHIELGSNLEDILDEDIKEPSNLAEMCSIFKLGVECTAQEPASRPSMKEVLKTLINSSNPFSKKEKNAGFYDDVPLLENSKWEKHVY